jgi:peptide/nickel transport system ATP-binding protein
MSSSSSSSSLLSVKNLTVKLGIANTSIDIIDNVSLELPSVGYSLGIVGESGSGKTTLAMSLINAIEPPLTIANGSVVYHGGDILNMTRDELRKYRGKAVSMVPQASMNSLNPVKRIYDPIVEVLREHKGVPKNEAIGMAKKLLSRVGLPADRMESYPYQLSGGMRQRVMIALALSASPDLVIADEPTSALDVVAQEGILSLLKSEIIERKMSLIYITHEISLLGGLVDNVAVVYRGEIVEIGPVDKVLFAPKHPYTESLVGSLLSIESSSDNLVETGTGEAKPSMPIKNACKYSDRCRYAFERCRTEKPRLLELKDDVMVSCHKYN